jgi:RNA polymerase sigma-70 factor (ECF subfamily)
MADLSHTLRSDAPALHDDDECMKRLANGDASALRPIFNRWKLPLMNFLYRSLGSHADAEDLTLNVFEEVWRLAPQYRAEGTFGAWIFSLARGRLRHEWRRRSRNPVQAVASEELTSTKSSAEASPADKLQMEETLLQGLRDLPEKQREAILLKIHSTLDSEEAARSLGVRTDHFHVLVSRARSALKKAFSP